MSIFASCGHEVFSGEDMVPVEYDDEDIDHDEGVFMPVKVMATFCPKCAAEGIKAGWLRHWRP